jgi:16S rRNA (guanine966-N2)-methyltransferase
MRIISGKKRGTLLSVPEGGLVRPTADRAREGVFNLLTGGRYGKPLEVHVIADIFAGSGSMGLEAWSRGAMQVVFVENGDAALTSLQANIKKLGCGDAVHVLPRDATRKLAWPAAPAGLVFLDPPWRKKDDDSDLAASALENLISLGAIADAALISVEHDHRRPPEIPHDITLLETRRWGKSALSIYRYAA